MNPKKRPYRITLLQRPSALDYQENLTQLIQDLKNHPEQQLIMAPEVYLTAYDYEHFESAIAFYDQAIEAILPHIGPQIFVFTIIRREKDQIVNQATVIHNHQIIYQQNKYRLFKIGNEDKYFQAGEQQHIQPFEIEGVRYGILICFELRFKALWEQLEGVDILLIPAMWGKPRKRHLEVLSQALAVMNQSFVVVCNSANEDMAKSSAIISPWGEVVMDDTKTVITHSINLTEVKKVRRLIPMR